MRSGEQNGFSFEDISFLILLLIVSLAFAWLIAPYFGAILWGIVAAILFWPVNGFLLRLLPGKKNIAAGLTLLLIVVAVIAPAISLGMALINEAASIYARIETGEIDIARIFERLRSGLPRWAADILARSGVGNLADARATLTSAVASGFRVIASQALTFGQGAFKFIASLAVMLYLIFFLLRDGENLRDKITDAIPLQAAHRDRLVRNFTVVIRATIKGSIVVAIVQGLVGGIIFSILGIQGALFWGVLMGAFSLVPALGTGLVWAPVAIYLFATGSIWEGTALALCGFFIIGLIDNILRPILVGKDTRMPDFVVLISTLAGLELFGLSGFIVGPMIAALFISVWNSLTEIRSHWEAVDNPPG